MREDRELCVHYLYHQQKLVFFLSAMRTYAGELKKAGLEVHYEKLGETSHPSYESALSAFLAKHHHETLCHFEIEDKFFENRIFSWAQKHKLPRESWNSPMFLTERTEFAHYLKSVKKPFMKTFYERQRKRLRILVDAKLEPVGGRWSFDDENRSPLPTNYRAPIVAASEPARNSKIENEVKLLIEREFAKHPGSASDAWLPTDREGAQVWLERFLRERFHDFGAYEDALSFGAHSVFECRAPHSG
jgi:deoxyribodipyrimidine photolyase-related protein